MAVSTASGRWATSGNRILAVAGSILGFLLLIPWYPAMPAPGLDPSWASALNAISANGGVFGRDLVFTFGPLAVLYTQLYNPSTDGLALIGSAIFAAGLVAGCWLVAPRDRRGWIILLPIVIGLCHQRDIAFMVGALFLLLYCFRLDPARAGGYGWNRRAIPPGELVAVLALTVSIALTPLIKGSFTGIVTAVGGLSLLLCLHKRYWGLAVALVITVAATICTAWLASGQPASALAGFFVMQMPIIAGYTGAMAIPGKSGEIFAWWLGAGAFVALWIDASRGKLAVHRMLLLAGIAVFLFIVFKATFVRHDGHAQMGADVLLFMLLIALLAGRGRFVLPVATVCLMASLWLSFSVTGEPLRKHAERLQNALRNPVKGIRERALDASALSARFEESNARIRDAAPFTLLAGTADVYPTELAPLFASGVQWSGRPVPQSYSAYTRVLLAMNAAHLGGASAPDHIYFTVHSIDGRYPSLDDASSWPLLMSRYRVTDSRNGWLTLTRRPPLTVAFGHASSVASGFDQWIAVSGNDAMAWANIDMRPSPMGKLLQSVYKLDPVWMDVRLRDGGVLRHRVIADIAREGFLLSPYVASTDDFLQAVGGEADADVVAVRFHTDQPAMWLPEIRLTTRAMRMEPQRHAIALTRTYPLKDAPRYPTGLQAACAVDELALRPGNALRVRGWAVPGGAVAAADGIIATLSDTSGRQVSYWLPVHHRPDVAKSLGKPEAIRSGFESTLDLGGLRDTLGVSFAAVSHGVAHPCPVNGLTVTLAVYPRADPRYPIAAAPALCAIDRLVARKGGEIDVRGWATPPLAQGRAPEAIWLMLDDAAGQRSSYLLKPVPRPDVGKALGAPALAMAGFEAVLADSSAADGERRLTAVAMLDGEFFRCPHAATVGRVAGISER